LGSASSFRDTRHPEAGASQNAEFDVLVDVKRAAAFLGVSPSLVYAYVERKQIPHFRMMGSAIRFSLSELAEWRLQFHVNGGINEAEEEKRATDKI
jgi:excisionase family DNA binding protein